MKTCSIRTLCYLLITLILFQSSISAFAYCDPIQNRKFQIGDVRKNIFYGSTFWYAFTGKFRMQLWFYIPIADKHNGNIPIYQWGDPDKITDKRIGGIKLKYNDNKNLTVDLQLYGCTNLACVGGDYAPLITKSFSNITKGEWHFLSIAVDGSKTRGPWWKPWTWEWYTSAEIRVDRELYRQDPYMGDFGAWNPYYNYAWLYNFITLGLYGWLTDDYYDYHRVTPLSDTHTLFYDNVLWCTQRYSDRRCHDDEDYNLDACPYPGKINYCSIAISSKPLSCTEAEVAVVVDEIEAGRRARDFHNPYGHGFWYHLLFSIYYSIDNVFDHIFGRYELHYKYSYDRWEKQRRKNTFHLIDLGSNSSDVTWNGLTNNFFFYNQTTLTPTRTPTVSSETNVSYNLSTPVTTNYNYLSFTQSNGLNNDAEFKFKVNKQASAQFNSIYVMARHTAADGFNMPEGMHQASTEVKFSNTQAMNMTFSSTDTTRYSTSDDSTALISGDERPITMTATAGFSATGQNTTQSCGASFTDTSYTGPKKLQFNLKYVAPTTAPQSLRLSLGETNKTNYSIVADKWTDVELNFENGRLSSKQTLSVRYDDVGKISLKVKEGDKILGEMPLTVMPYYFKVEGVNDSLINIVPTPDKNKQEKIKAGAPFTVNVQAYNLLDKQTPSFTKAATINDYPVLNSNYVAGGTGCTKDLAGTQVEPKCTPILNYTRTPTATNNGQIQYTNVTWEQVGYVGMSAERPAQFLGVNYPEKLKTVRPSVPVIVGRFIPDHFDVTPSTRPSYNFACNTFTYRGQPFSVDNPYTLTITPKSAQGNTTTGYRGDWQKLEANKFSTTSYILFTPPDIADQTSPYAEQILPDKVPNPVIEGPDVNTSFTLRQDPTTQLFFERKAPEPDAGQPAIKISKASSIIKHTVSVCDADKVTVINDNEKIDCKSYNFNGGFVSDGKIYHGRTVLKDRATGNNEDRTLEVEIQKFENGSWQPNFDDSTCTTATNLRLDSTIKNPPPSTAPQPLSWDYITPINDRKDTITMTGTGNSSQGPTFSIPITLTPIPAPVPNTPLEIKLKIYLNTLNVPWLQYNSSIDLSYPFAPGPNENMIQLTQ